jgi:hypothetical protein
MRIYRAVSSPSPPPPFRLDVLLRIPELVNNQVLVHISPDNHARTRIHPTPPYILLESWLLQFDPNPSSSHSSASSSPLSSSHDTPDVAPSTIYKHGIPLFRSFYTLLRILPAWKLHRRLRRKVGGNRNGNFSIQIRLHNTDRDEARVLRFGEPPRCCNAATTSHLPTTLQTHLPQPTHLLSQRPLTNSHPSHIQWGRSHFQANTSQRPTSD